MKLNLENSQNNNLMAYYGHHRLKKSKIEKHKSNSEKNNEIRPTQALSFGGSVDSWGRKFINSKKINSLIKFVGDNEAAYNAIYSLVIAGMMKPLFVLKFGSDDDKDNQIIATKNFLQAFIGSFLSFTLGGCIIKRSTDALKNNLKLIKPVEEEIIENGIPVRKVVLKALEADSKEVKEVVSGLIKKENFTFAKRFKNGIAAYRDADSSKFDAFKKVFKDKGGNFVPDEKEVTRKAAEFVNELKTVHVPIFSKNTDYVAKLLKSAKDLDADCTMMDVFESLWKNSTGLITAIGKAKISSWILPSVMAFLFTKKNLENARKKAEENNTTLNTNFNYQNKREQFEMFMNKKQNVNQASPSFTGKITQKISNLLTIGVENLSMSKFGEKAAKALSKLGSKPSARMGDIESIGLTGYWVANTTRSKKIEQKQKLALNVHTVLVTAVSSAAAFLLDTLFDNPIKKAATLYGDEIRGAVKKLPESIKQSADKNVVESAIKEQCSKLLGSSGIAKKIAKTGFDDPQALEIAIKQLSNGYQKKLGKLKSLTIFTLVVRFLVPVLMVKPSAKVKQKIIERKERENAKLSAA